MTNTHSQQALFNMIEQQIRPAEVLDAKVLNLIGQVPRDAFVPTEYAALAFADTNIPIGEGQLMMKPIVEARMLQALDIQPTDNILEIGTGSGYVTALLAHLGKNVISVEIKDALLAKARQHLDQQGVKNVELCSGDGAKGWPGAAPYDVIAVTGSMPILAAELKQQLSIGGRLFVIVGTAPVMEALLITRMGDNQWREEALFETELPALDNVEQPPAFVF